MKWLRRLRTLLARKRVDDDIRRELDFHLAMETESMIGRGRSADEARRVARAEFGGADQARERVRDARGLTIWDHFVQDIRFGFRLFWNQPGFTLVAVLILALGIGANAAVFSLVNAMLLKPLPGHPNGALAGVYHRDTAHADTYRAFSYPDYVDMRARTDVFASLAAHNMAMAGLKTGDATKRVFIDVVTANFFDLFGAPPVLGRPFTEAEERPGANVPVTILSYTAWQRMGGTPDIIGRTIRLNERDFEIVGVAPKGFGGSVVIISPELWVPTGVYDTISNDFVRDGLTTTLADRRHFNLMLLARLKPGQTPVSVAPGLETISHSMASAFPADNTGFAVELAPLSRTTISTSPADDTALTGVTAALLSMAVVVLLVASCNLANMLLARSGARRKEFAIRLAIGGSRGRLVRQLLTEGFLLAVAGGAAGIVLAVWATRLLFAALTPISPLSFSFDPAPDWRILTATLAYCAFSTIVFALLPARSLARTDPAPALKDQAGELPQRRRSRLALPNTLVMSQLALSLVLITVAALFMRGATEAAKADPGFSFDRGVLLQIDPSMAGMDAARSRELHRSALAKLRARPEVTAAALATIIPFGDIQNGINAQLPGTALVRGDIDRAKAEQPDATLPALVDATLTGISAQYFKALGRPIIAGRDFTQAEEESPTAPRIAIVDEPFARELFGEANPVGRQFQYTPRGEGQAPIVVDVVGLAPGFRNTLFDAAPTPHVYFPIGREFQTGVWIHLSTSAPTAEAEAALLPSFRRDLMSVDAGLPVIGVETRAMFGARNLLLAVVRVGAVIFTIFGAVALFLAAVGIYGVKAYLVSRRTREIGVRIALGATPGRVVWMVVRDGLVASVIGLGVGVLLSVLAGAALRNLTYQGRAADAAVLGLALSVLAGATLLASWLPARRATRIAPLRALRD